MPVPDTIKSMKMNQESTFDVIIIGGSYAGLAAAMALGRALRNVLVIDGGNPCNRQTPHSHNFLTNDGKTPAEISQTAKWQVLQYDSVQFLDDLTLTARQTNGQFEVMTQTGRQFRAKKLILATGIKDILPGIPGFAESWGISVLHCPYCHGYEVRGQITGILGNGETGYEMATLLSNWTNQLTLFTNGPSTLTRDQQSILERLNIPIAESPIDYLNEVNGRISHIHFRNGMAKPLNVLYARLPFEQHSPIAAHLGCDFTAEGYIQIDASQQSTVKGVYTCGDNSSRMRTVANAVSMGTTAGIMVNRELIEESLANR